VLFKAVYAVRCRNLLKFPEPARHITGTIVKFNAFPKLTTAALISAAKIDDSVDVSEEKQK